MKLELNLKTNLRATEVVNFLLQERIKYLEKNPQQMKELALTRTDLEKAENFRVNMISSVMTSNT